MQYKGLLVDITKKKVSIDGIEISLTKKEFEILLLLLQNKGRVFSREDILAKVWQEKSMCWTVPLTSTLLACVRK